MKAELINLGRNDVNKVIEVKNVKELHREVKKYILSRDWGIEATDTPNLYAVYAGFATVGHVRILEN